MIGFAGKFTEQSITSFGQAHQMTLPNIEYVLWAVVFGLIVSNTVGVPEVFQRGVETYELLAEGWDRAARRSIPARRRRRGGVSLVCVASSWRSRHDAWVPLGRRVRLTRS